MDCGCPKHNSGCNDKFYYQGKFFEKEEDFWAYVIDFSTRKTNAEDFSGLFDMLKKDVWMNIILRNPEMTNSQVRDLLDATFTFMIKNYGEIMNECDKCSQNATDCTCLISLGEGIDPPAELPPVKYINVNGREEHESILRDSKKMWEMGLDPYFEKIIYIKRWGNWLNGSTSYDGKL